MRISLLLRVDTLGSSATTFQHLYALCDDQRTVCMLEQVLIIAILELHGTLLLHKWKTLHVGSLCISIVHGGRSWNEVGHHGSPVLRTES